MFISGRVSHVADAPLLLGSASSPAGSVGGAIVAKPGDAFDIFKWVFGFI